MGGKKGVISSLGLLFGLFSFFLFFQLSFLLLFLKLCCTTPIRLMNPTKFIFLPFALPPIPPTFHFGNFALSLILLFRFYLFRNPIGIRRLDIF